VRAREHMNRKAQKHKRERIFDLENKWAKELDKVSMLHNEAERVDGSKEGHHGQTSANRTKPGLSFQL
jgi:hypothetical protein